MSIVYKYDTKEVMKGHRTLMENLINENREKWSSLGDLDSIKFQEWEILCERVNDTIFDQVMNKTDDVYCVRNIQIPYTQTTCNSNGNGNENGNENISNWDVSNVINNHMFHFNNTIQ